MCAKTGTANCWLLAAYPAKKGWETFAANRFCKSSKAAGSYSFNYALDSVMQKMLDHSKGWLRLQARLRYNSIKPLPCAMANVPTTHGYRNCQTRYQKLPGTTTPTYPPMICKWGYVEGDVVKIDVTKSDGSTYSISLPVSSQPGQAQGTISVAVGYRRTIAGPVGDNVGQNAFPFQSLRNGYHPNRCRCNINRHRR